MGAVVASAAALLGLLAAAPLAAQDSDRIWGTVETRDGEVLKGFIRWDRNEGSWGDVLNGLKRLPPESPLLAPDPDPEEARRRRRVVELMGFRISWNEPDPETREWVDAGIRFGHLHRLTRLDDDQIELVLKSGEVVEFAGGSTDVGGAIRELTVTEPGRAPVDLRWRELEQVTFGPVPATVAADAPRLYGTVEDRWGNRFSGYLSWDLDEILTSDILDGEERGRDREIPFGEIAAIEKDWSGALVTLLDGRELELSGTNDVDAGHRGVQISDPALGMIEVEWDEFASVRFHEPDAFQRYEDFDGGRTLEGTVVLDSGEEISGVILWDGDEAATWEFLDGSYRDVVFDVEFGMIARIERATALSAKVTLTDGRTLELRDSNDVTQDNRGIFVAPVPAPGADPAEQPEWVEVSWDNFREVRFNHGTVQP